MYTSVLINYLLQSFNILLGLLVALESFFLFYFVRGKNQHVLLLLNQKEKTRCRKKI